MSLIVTMGYGDSGIGSGFVLTSVTPFADHLDLAFTHDPGAVSGDAANPAKYVCTPLAGGDPMSVTGVAIVGTVLRLTITPVDVGGLYQLTIPQVGLVDVFSNSFQGSFTPTFTAVLAPLALSIVQAIDARTLQVVFSRPPNRAEALVAGNYSIAPTLAVHSVAYVTDFVYQLTTDRQTPGTNYTLTTTGINDLT